MAIPFIDGLSSIAARYDGFILDIWGVMHEGGPVYPAALDCVKRLRHAGKRVVFLSNAPRRAERVAAVLADKGVGPDLYDAVLSSGEATRRALAARTDAPAAGLGSRYYLFGPSQDDDLLDELGYRLTDRVVDADFLLAIGFDRDRQTVADYEPIFQQAAALALPMICVNPDRLVIRLGRRELCAGALADRYAALGGPVHYFGKPHAEVYRLSLETIGLNQIAVLAVGDGLETDIPGAMAYGLDSLLVTGGLLADALGHDPEARPSDSTLWAACSDAGVMPSAAVARLAW